MGKSKSLAASAAGDAKQHAPGPSSGPVVVQKVVKRDAPAAPKAPSQHHPFVEAMIDPRLAPSVRVPDNFKSGTTAIKLVEEYTVSSNAGGFALFGQHPGLVRSSITNTFTGNSSSVAESYGNHPDYTAFLAAHSKARVVMYMVEITYIGAEQTSAGRLCCVSVTGIDSYLGVAVDSMFDDATCVMPAQAGMSCIVRPYQDPRFEHVDDLTFGANHLHVMYFGLAGAPVSTNLFDVRVTKFLEGVPKRNSLMRGMTAVEPAVPNALAIAANIGTETADTVANTHEGRTGQVSRARKMADLAWKLLLVAGPSFGIPAGALASMGSIVGQLSSMRLGA